MEPRLREQEFGNLQGDEFIKYREEQTKVIWAGRTFFPKLLRLFVASIFQIGRFWYRFPTGESGADVYDRVKQVTPHSPLSTP